MLLRACLRGWWQRGSCWQDGSGGVLLYRKNSALQKRFPYHQRFKSTHPALHQRKRTRPHTRLLEKRFRLQWPSGAKALARHGGICVRCMCCASVLPALVHACTLNMNSTSFIKHVHVSRIWCLRLRLSTQSCSYGRHLMGVAPPGSAASMPRTNLCYS